MKRREKQIYKTHPAVKAALTLSLFLTLAVCAASYGFYRYMKEESAATEELRERCAYEAYVSLCENFGRGELTAAADALSRCELYTGTRDYNALRYAILSGDESGEIADALGLDNGSIADALRRADGKARDLGFGEVPRVLGASSSAMMWETLDRRIEISEEEAHRIATEYAGGGAALTRVENHTFPLVYTYTCKNASVDVTRMGGRLLRFYAYRHGGAEERGASLCRGAAERFLEEAGIQDGVMISAADTEDGYEYVFCGSFELDGATVTCISETVKIAVSRAGARVNYFDSYEYYKNKPISYDLPEIVFDRHAAAEKLGVNDLTLSLIFAGGRIFWCQSGVKTPWIDAENGEIRVQNP